MDDEDFKELFASQNLDKDLPNERVLIFTTEKLMERFAYSKKASIDGTFCIAPQAWKQVFILALKVGDKFLPVAFGLLPYKEGKSYDIFFKMLTHYLGVNNISNNLEKIIVDFEAGIHNAIKNSWPNVQLLGCRFPFSFFFSFESCFSSPVLLPLLLLFLPVLFLLLTHRPVLLHVLLLLL